MSDEQYWTEFGYMLRGELNKLPMRVPPRVRKAMEDALLHDDWMRDLDRQADVLHSVAKQLRDTP